MNSLLHHPFPELHLCRHSEFILPLSVSTIQLKQTGGTGKLPENWLLFSGQKKYSAFDKAFDCLWVLLSLFPFCGWIFCCELQSPFTELLGWFQHSWTLSLEEDVLPLLPTVQASSSSLSLLTLASLMVCFLRPTISV